MTTCGAMFWTSTLYQCAPFDLVVFDEASQVGLAYAMALATFGKHCLFAGDPAQLAPVVKSEHRQPRQWLGRSPFDAISISTDAQPGPRVFLDEQSRMHGDICEVISRQFYREKLHVARDAQNNPKWHRDRELNHPRPRFRYHVSVVQVPASSVWSQKYHGPIRFDSAKAVVRLVSDLLTHEEPESILVLTPFRAQRALLRSMLRQDCKGVSISTVHRAQGTERRTIIFDPVDGNSNFLLGDEARRLVNVALSRAEARLVLILSEADRQNPLFQHPKFVTVRFVDPATTLTSRQACNGETSTTTKPSPSYEPIASYVRRRDFPRCIQGIRVLYKNAYGEEIRGTASVTRDQITIEADNGGSHTYSADFLRAMCSKRK
jgi:hypothetical protein